MKEREINLIDLGVEMLLHWRVAVLLVLVGCVCFSGFSYLISYRNVESQKKQQALEMEAQKQAEENPTGLLPELKKAVEEAEDIEGIFRRCLTGLQITNVKWALSYEAVYEERIQYVEESLLMEINPYEVPKTQVLFWVKADDVERTYDIEKVYESLVNSNDLYEYLKSEYGINELTVKEFVKLDYVTLGSIANSGVFQITIVHYDEKQCSVLAQAIIDYVEEWEQKLQENLGKHDVIVLSQSHTLTTDVSVASQQRMYVNDILNNVSAAVRIKEAFSVEEKMYYNYLNGERIEDIISFGEEQRLAVVEGKEGQGQIPATIPTPSISMKYSILGVVLMAFVYAFFILLRYVLGNKIRYTDDLQELYEVPQLGQIPRVRVKKPFGFVDEWVYALRDRAKRRFSREEATNLAAMAVKMAVKKNGLNSVSLIGCDIKKRTLDTCNQIKGILAKEGIEVDILNNVLYDAETMESVCDAQGVVLVETAGSTLYDEIVKELSLAKRQNVAVLGGIVQE